MTMTMLTSTIKRKHPDEGLEVQRPASAKKICVDLGLDELHCSIIPALPGREQHDHDRLLRQCQWHNIAQLQQKPNSNRCYDELYFHNKPKPCKRKRTECPGPDNVNRSSCTENKDKRLKTLLQAEDQAQNQSERYNIQEAEEVKMESRKREEADASYNQFNFWREVLPSVDEDTFELSTQTESSSDTEMDLDTEDYMVSERVSGNKTKTDPVCSVIADPDFNQFNFWKNPIPDLDIPDMY